MKYIQISEVVPGPWDHITLVPGPSENLTNGPWWGPGRGGRLTSDLDHFFCDLALFREKSTDLAKIHFLSVTRTETH